MTGSSIFSDEELGAFVDGELEPDRATALRETIALDPALAQMVARLAEDRRAIQRIYGPLVHEPLPAALRAAVQGSRPRIVWRPALAAAALAILVAGGWLALRLEQSPADRLVAEAMATRQGDRRPAEQFDGATLPAPAARDGLLKASLGTAVRVPDLSRAGFQLARLTVFGQAAEGRSVELGYKDGQGRLFTVYLHHPTGRDGFELRRSGATRICVWQNEDLAAIMVAEMPEDEILRVASLTYADLNF